MERLNFCPYYVKLLSVITLLSKKKKVFEHKSFCLPPREKEICCFLWKKCGKGEKKNQKGQKGEGMPLKRVSPAREWYTLN